MDQLKILLGNSNPELGKKICRQLGLEPTPCLVDQFPDGEIHVQILDNVRGMDVFIIQSTNPPSENLLELLIMIDAALRASARRVTAVIPYYGYARQDRKDAPRVPISSKLIANLLSKAGANRVLTMDLHVAQIQGFFDIPVDHLFTNAAFHQHIAKVCNFDPDELVLVAPDPGAVKLVSSMAKKFGVPLVVMTKDRQPDGSVKIEHLIGEVKGKVVLIRDDVIDGGGTLIAATDEIIRRGGKEVYLCCTHGILSGKAMQKLEDHPHIRQLFVSDTVQLPPEKRTCKLNVVSMDWEFAEAIKRIHLEQPLTELFD